MFKKTRKSPGKQPNRYIYPGAARFSTSAKPSLLARQRRARASRTRAGEGGSLSREAPPLRRAVPRRHSLHRARAREHHTPARSRSSLHSRRLLRVQRQCFRVVAVARVFLETPGLLATSAPVPCPFVPACPGAAPAGVSSQAAALEVQCVVAGFLWLCGGCCARPLFGRGEGECRRVPR